MRDPGHGRLRHGGMFEECGLHLARHHVVPAPDDHLFLPPDYPKVAVGVDSAEVAAQEPAADPCSVSSAAIVQVRPRPPRAGDGNLADRSGLHIRALRVDDLYLYPREREADRAEVLSAVAHRHGGDRTELRHAISTKDLGAAEPRAEALQRARRDRRAAHVDDGQAREVGRGEAGGPDDQLHHGGDEKARHRPVPFDRRNPPLGVETREEPSAEASSQRSADQKGAAGRRERRRGEEAEPEPVTGDALGGGQAAVAHDDTLGESRGAGRVHHVGGVVRVDGKGKVAVVRGQQPFPGFVGRREHLRRRHPQALCCGAAAEGDGHPCVPQQARQLAGAQPRQQRHGDRADLVDGDVGGQPFERFVLPDLQRDPVALRHALVPEPPRQSVRPSVPLRQRHGAAVGDIAPGDLVRESRRQLGEELGLEEGHRVSRGRRPPGSAWGSPRAWS